jgi:hypothetical protein
MTLQALKEMRDTAPFKQCEEQSTDAELDKRRF